MDKEFYSIVSRFTFRSSRVTFELTRLMAILDGDEGKILDYKDIPLSLTLIESAQEKLDNFFAQQVTAYDYGALISKLKLVHEMLIRPLPTIGQISASELAPYKEEPDEALRLLKNCQEMISQLRVRPL